MRRLGCVGLEEFWSLEVRDSPERERERKRERERERERESFQPHEMKDRPS